MHANFWNRLDDLVAQCGMVIDRPKGTPHPRHPDFIYPYDYGYLPGTQAVDGGGIDVWIGSQAGRRVTAVICTVDALKQDAELKLLIDCTLQEAQEILKTHNEGSQSALLIPRDATP